MQAVATSSEFQDWKRLARGHKSNYTRINAGGQNAATIQVIPRPLLRSNLGHLARYCTHQETISGTPGQVYLSFDQDCKDLGRGHYLSQTQINAGGSKCVYYSIIQWEIIKVKPGARYCTHQVYD